MLMKRKRYTEPQIVFALQQAEAGTPVAELCRKMGVAEATFYRWKKRYGELGVSEIRRLRQLEDENGRLKQLVADLTLDKAMLQDVLRKRTDGCPSPSCGGLPAGELSGQRTAGVWSAGLLPRDTPLSERGGRARGTTHSAVRSGNRSSELGLSPTGVAAGA